MGPRANRLARTSASARASVGAILLASAGSASAQAPADPKKECLAASEQGQNERDEGKFRAARHSFATCTREICPRLVTDLCTKWLHELDQVAPTIVLSAKDEQGNDIADVNVTFDGAPFATVLDGKPIEADAGTHFLHFERGGSAPVDRTVNIRQGERARLINVVLGPPTALGGASGTGLTGTPDAESPSTSASSHAHPSAARYVTSGALGLVGIGAVATGMYFLTQSNHNADDATVLRDRLNAMNTSCSRQPPPACLQLADKVQAEHDDMAVATTLLVGGGVFVAGAITAFFLWPAAVKSSPQTSAWIAPTEGGATIQVARRFP